ncbi:Valacyclovir hydrolase [Lasiodiplodia theobromae]|uniref:Valacyclovir hydrolase n=1 Tax=Lasiodiplodia theobromae TaxID=45133 RepID=A0A5N5DNH7_9PEZI|nr:Valacyclovir hydrolase [Lasiodiplodia theobromae]
MAAKALLLPLLAISGLVQASPLAARQSEAWTTLPATPNLPAPISSTKAAINGVELWFQKYNEAAGGTPVVFIHGGLGYSAYFGDVISSVSKKHYVIAVDRRGHGRSTYGANDKFTFEMFAKDTYDLLKAEGVDKALWVGWSDGAATTLAGLLDSTISASISKAFVFAGFQSFSDTNTTFSDTAIYSEFVSRCGTEYAELQPSANFKDFATKVGTLEATLPTWTDADLAKINGAKVTISGADHDEAVNLDVPEHLNSAISGSKLVMMTGVSHFAPVQDPAQFSQKIEDFIAA